MAIRSGGKVVGKYGGIKERFWEQLVEEEGKLCGLEVANAYDI